MLRKVLDALLPPGSLWVPESYRDLDKLLDGIGDNSDKVMTFLESVARIRNPLLTPYLADLEIDFGIIPDNRIAESVRRNRLLAVKTADSGNGTAEWLRELLQDSGFDVQVHINNPAIDPQTMLQFDSSTIFNDDDSHLFGEDGVEQFVAVGGELLVNGPLYVSQALVSYASPANAAYWPLVFFVGGTATLDETTGEIIALGWAQVPIARKTEFIRSLVKYKPMHTWVALKVEYT